MSNNPQNSGEFAIVPWRDKILFMLLEIGGVGIAYYLGLTLATYFFTDVMHISAATLGLIIIVSRCCDAFSDLLVGMLVDRTRTRLGKARPWVLIGVFPYMISMVLMYCVPSGSATAQIAYVAIIYNLSVTVCYTAWCIPTFTYASMTTRDQKQRGQITSLRQVASPIGSAIGVAVALPLINYLGGRQIDWIKVMTMFAIIGIAVNTLLCIFVKERVIPPAIVKGEKRNRLDLPSALSNPSFWQIVIFTTIYSVYLVGFSTMNTYYCKYWLGNTLLTGTINTVQSVALALTAFLCFTLAGRVKKITLVKLGMILVVPGQLIIAIAPTSMPVLLAGTVFRSIGWGFLGGTMFGLSADTIEYGHWRTGHRAEGTTLAATGIGNKLGVLIGGGIYTMLMGVAGYDGALEVQSASAMNMISFLYIWSPLIFAVIVFIVAFTYKVDRDYNKAIADLKEGKFHPKAKFIG